MLVSLRMEGNLAEQFLQKKPFQPAPGVPTPAQPTQVQPMSLQPTATTAHQTAEHQQLDAKVNSQATEQSGRDQGLPEQAKGVTQSAGSSKSDDVDSDLDGLQADARALLNDPEDLPEHQRDTATSPKPKVILHVHDDPAECVWLTLCNPPTLLWHMHWQVAIPLLARFCRLSFRGTLPHTLPR